MYTCSICRSIDMNHACPGPTAAQPAPIANDKPPLWMLVIDDTLKVRWPIKNENVREHLVFDMRARDDFGRAKYDTPLQAGNGRDALSDAYQEALDLCVYMKQACVEARVFVGADREWLYGDALWLAYRIREQLYERDGR